jgi:hypothetical protein
MFIVLTTPSKILGFYEFIIYDKLVKSPGQRHSGLDPESTYTRK